MAGVTIELLAAGADGEHGTGDDPVVASTVSGPAGCYEIRDVENPGAYTVRIAGPAAAICDSDGYSFSEVGVARATLDPIGPVVTVNFGVAP